MMIQLVTQHPEAIGSILKGTPGWVWGLLAALVALGLSQVRTRSLSLVRVAIMPVAMGGLSLWGTISAFGASPMFGYVLLAWALGVALLVALIAPLAAPAGTRFDAATRSFHVPGSVIPMLLILGIFLTKYIVGVDLAMQPSLAHDGQYTLIVGALYGLFSGIFAGRAARLWRLALRRDGTGATPALSA